MWKDLTAGTIGGVSGVVVGQPMDTVKVRLQTNAAYRGTWHCLSTTAAREGPLALFRGVLPPIFANAPINATVFAAHGAAIRHLQQRKGAQGDHSSLQWYDHMLAGSLAGAAQCLFATPNELIKIKQQGQPGRQATTFGLFTKCASRGALFQG